jgi:hypothetical protein
MNLLFHRRYVLLFILAICSFAAYCQMDEDAIDIEEYALQPPPATSCQATSLRSQLFCED